MRPVCALGVLFANLLLKCIVKCASVALSGEQVFFPCILKPGGWVVPR